MPGCSRAASTRASRTRRLARSPYVSGTSRTFEVGLCEALNGTVTFALRAQSAQALDGEGKEAAHPRVLEKLLEGFRRSNFRGVDRGCAQLSFRSGEIQRNMRDTSAALLTPA